MPIENPGEKAILKSALLGESVIDWPRLFCETKEDVLQLLKVNEFHLTQSKDHAVLMGLHSEAIGYLQNQLHFNFPENLLKPATSEELFLAASRFEDPPLQKLACSLLKVMNVIRLLNGRELLYNLPISSRDLFSLAEDKIERELSSLSKKGIRYQGGRKLKESLITRVIVKRDTIGIPTHDRLRFQIITPKKEDIEAVILHLFSTVLPINYLIPNASVNRLIDMHPYLPWKQEASLRLSKRLKGLNLRLVSSLPHITPDKEHSGKKYDLVKFMVAVPIRLDRYLNNSQHHLESLGNIAQVPVEIRLMDQETERRNDLGENAYPL
ncbi:MAG: TIGR04552 family protein, partial [Deltaproteobacteria bacterium]|nr:TIGR04552 family protein [Deltaproteobacteria bacterium]